MSTLSLLTGAAAGFIATVPMTAAMKVMHNSLPHQQRYPLPPSEITEKVEEEAGVKKEIDESEHKALTLLAHFGYGAAAGAVYGPLADEYRFPPVAGGVVFGIATWGLSYMGLLPAMGILRPATEHPARRNALMIASHIIWGSVMGLLVDRFERNR